MKTSAKIQEVATNTSLLQAEVPAIFNYIEDMVPFMTGADHHTFGNRQNSEEKTVTGRRDKVRIDRILNCGV